MVFGCLHMVGGPYALLQMYAWSTMFAGYSQESGILRGAVDTFSGDRPCELCRQIAAAERGGDEKEGIPMLPTKAKDPAKLVQEMMASEMDELPRPRSLSVPLFGFVAVLDWHLDFVSLPPTPPPRGVA